MTYDQTHWVPVRRQRQLSTFYYHEHFLELLAFVERHYAHVLLAEHANLIERFRALPRPAQCLYVRLVNRKGRLFAVNRLRYPELGDVAEIVTLLRNEGWIGRPGLAHFADLLRFLTRAEILDALRPQCAGLSRSLKKPELVAFALDNADRELFLAQLTTGRLCVQRHAEQVRYLLFLYFGRVQDGLTQFTMRDLGLVRVNGVRDAYEARFGDREEALEHFYFEARHHRLARADDAERDALMKEAGSWPEPNFAGSAAARDRLAEKLGRAAERAGDYERALGLYARGESPACGEREVRLLFSEGRRDAARALLQRRLAEPRSEEEWLFARDLYQRKFENKRTSKATDALRAGETIDLDESACGAPERAAARHFETRGARAFRVENQLWRTFFGLLFWQELFADEDAASHSPFEFLPAAIADGTFHERCSTQIAGRLALLDDRAALRHALLKTATAHFGAANGIFRWRRSVLDALFAFVEHAEPAAMRSVLERLCRDYKSARYGYPDLLLIDDRGVRFVEIKAEGDLLRRNQLLRLEQLREAGFRADVVRVRWVLDPEQTYVVVDVETTGGRGENHRVTEIGAVKVRGDEIVDRFQTLLNPQRAIPPGITRLTGITEAMVHDAPYFADIADEFADFLSDAIFVAHNVEFDYGFIGREFGRLGRSFRHAKLCTCASMRKLYPGHRSYSLAALCRAFDIPLKSHHRALCDAEAAAELLLLVNERRRELLA